MLLWGSGSVWGLLWALAWMGLILHRSQAGLGLGPLCPRMDATSLGCCRPECWEMCGAGWWHCSEM